MVETKTEEIQSPEERAKEFLAQLTIIRGTVDALQEEVEKLLTRRLNPNTDAGRLVKTIQRLQQVLQVDFSTLEITVKQQGGFGPWLKGQLGRRT